MKNELREARGQMALPTPVGHAITDNDVLRVVREAYPEALSRKGVAHAVGRHVTPTIIDRLERLSASGCLVRDVQTWPNGARGYVYSYNKDADCGVFPF